MLMPTSQASTTLLCALDSNGIDPGTPSLNLRSYVALSRPSAGNLGTRRSDEVINQIFREGLTPLSGIFFSFVYFSFVC